MGLCGSDPPDPSRAYAAGIAADLQALPWRRQIDAAAQLGIPVTIDLPGRGPTTFDFTGLGTADYQAKYGDQMLQQLLDIQRDYGPAYVEQRLKELEAADPEGAAMRRRLWDAVQQDVTGARAASRPAAEDLQAQILSDLERGGNLSETTAQRVSSGVLGGQVARGNWLGSAPATEEAQALTSASENQASQAQQAALAFLTGGVSPQDVAARREQQGLTNLGAFISGETPTAQFAQLSGAQNGIAPFTSSGPGPTTNPNAGPQGIANANQFWSAQNQLSNSQVNPWIAGLSGAVSGWGLANAGGWRLPAAAPSGVTGGWNTNFGSQYAGQV